MTHYFTSFKFQYWIRVKQRLDKEQLVLKNKKICSVVKTMKCMNECIDEKDMCKFHDDQRLRDLELNKLNNNIKILNEDAQNDLKALVEYRRIEDMIENNPEVYKMKSDGPYASREKDWIYHSILDFFGQYNERGSLMTICQCGGCSKNHYNVSLQVKNKHCVFCVCKSCVCSARVLIGKYERNYIRPYWDNPCNANCLVCSINRPLF